MKAAVISFTKKGSELSMKLKQSAYFLEADRYCHISHTDNHCEIFERVKELVEEIFNKYDAIIFVCACGIAVRSIAPYIRSKTTDPAVVVIDDGGKFAIPILSGHIGGGNELAGRLSEIIGTQPVVTTATDTGGFFSPDSFAVANNLIISDMNIAKAVASAVLDGKKIGFMSDYKAVNIPDIFVKGSESDIGIYIGEADIKPFPLTLRLLPKNIVVGIGCKRGTNLSDIENSVRCAIENAGISFDRICSVATIDLKADENGLLMFCKKYDLQMMTYTALELSDVEGDFTSSDFVKTVAGVDNVCERSAVKSSRGKLVIHKTASHGVTVAAAEKPIVIDFKRRTL